VPMTLEKEIELLERKVQLLKELRELQKDYGEPYRETWVWPTYPYPCPHEYPRTITWEGLPLDPGPLPSNLPVLQFNSEGFLECIKA